MASMVMVGSYSTTPGIENFEFIGGILCVKVAIDRAMGPYRLPVPNKNPTKEVRLFNSRRR